MVVYSSGRKRCRAQTDCGTLSFPASAPPPPDASNIENTRDWTTRDAYAYCTGRGSSLHVIVRLSRSMRHQQIV
jgi:hypothetical protein